MKTNLSVAKLIAFIIVVAICTKNNAQAQPDITPLKQEELLTSQQLYSMLPKEIHGFKLGNFVSDEQATGCLQTGYLKDKSGFVLVVCDRATILGSAMETNLFKKSPVIKEDEEQYYKKNIIDFMGGKASEGEYIDKETGEKTTEILYLANSRLLVSLMGNVDIETLKSAAKALKLKL